MIGPYGSGDGSEGLEGWIGMSDTEFVWDPRIETGVPAIDREHREFFERIGAFLAGQFIGEGEREVTEFLPFLLHHCEEHFAVEEFFMRTRNYPGFSAHRKEHDAYRRLFSGADARRRQGRCGIRGRIDLIRVARTLFAEHMGIADRRFADFIRENTTPGNALVLAVDDSRALLDTVERKVRRMGHRLVRAGDGGEALRRLLEIRPDIVLLDIDMPVMNGIEWLEAVRVGDLIPGVPIIALTARRDLAAVKTCAALGVQDYLVKPFRLAHLAPNGSNDGSSDSHPRRSDIRGRRGARRPGRRGREKDSSLKSIEILVDSAREAAIVSGGGLRAPGRCGCSVSICRNCS